MRTKPISSLLWLDASAGAVICSTACAILRRPSEQTRGARDEYDHHDHENHRVRRFREKIFCKAFDDAEAENAVTIAPMIEPMPPITTTANTTMMMSAPMVGFTA